MSRYHINPKTGMPSVCHAQRGNCPYGGASGSEGHYESYSMAFEESQRRMSNEHKLLPANELADIELKKYESLSAKVERLPKDRIELKEAIRHTTDVELLKGIIEEKIYVEDGWDKISVALQNPNLPRQFINDVLYERKELYSDEARRHLMLNSALTHEDLMYALENSDDLYLKSVAMKNPSLKQEFSNDYLANKPEELTKLPYYMITENGNVDNDHLFGWHKWVLKNKVNIDRTEINTLNVKYSDWMVSYERSQRFDS